MALIAMPRKQKGHEGEPDAGPMPSGPSQTLPPAHTTPPISLPTPHIGVTNLDTPFNTPAASPSTPRDQRISQTPILVRSRAPIHVGKKKPLPRPIRGNKWHILEIGVVLALI